MGQPPEGLGPWTFAPPGSANGEAAVALQRHGEARVRRLGDGRWSVAAGDRSAEGALPRALADTLGVDAAAWIAPLIEAAFEAHDGD